MASLLLDIGGTFIKGAVYCSSIEKDFEVEVDSAGDALAIASSLRRAFLLGGEVSSVAVAVPGPFDYGEGVFLMKHKFASVYGQSFRSLAGVPEEVPIVFVHDVNCMLLGALSLCPEGGNTALVTLGTGLGFGLALGGRVQKAPSGSPAVSIWNMPFRDGILEDYVSSRGIRRFFGETNGLTVKDLALMAYSGDQHAAAAFACSASALAEALAPVLRSYEINALFFGGQISRSFSLLEPSLRPLLDSCPSLKAISPLPDISRATFLGLASLRSCLNFVDEKIYENFLGSVFWLEEGA